VFDENGALPGASVMEEKTKKVSRMPMEPLKLMLKNGL
jgi:hypothetical protein